MIDSTGSYHHSLGIKTNKLCLSYLTDVNKTDTEKEFLIELIMSKDDSYYEIADQILIQYNNDRITSTLG